MVSKELRNVLLNNSEKMKVSGEWGLAKHKQDHILLFSSGRGRSQSFLSVFSLDSFRFASLVSVPPNNAVRNCLSAPWVFWAVGAVT